ncbi:MAG: isoleucine--tRNA ligase, partial [Xanthomonadales bacterium]|nr:isoleucine--tRNA ligase [Xanthomonadales bacterium]
VRALARIVERGHVVQGVKPVHWCFDCRSALAEAEIEYQQHTSPAIDVLFEADDANALLAAFELDESAADGRRVGIPIWTTTPWTLPANQAVTLHPELDYALVSAETRLGPCLLVLASDMVDGVAERLGLDNPHVVGRAPGERLEHLAVRHPFHDRTVPVILGEHVTTEAGTGAVHTAPGHGHEDFDVGRRYDLPVTNPVGPDGRYLDDTELFGGLPVFEANQQIIDTLRDRKALLFDEPYQHSYPHCWRHKTPTAFRVTPQWFISMTEAGLQDDATAAIDGVRWVPGWGEERIRGMVSQRPDWCISRQRTWGVPIPLFTRIGTAERHPDSVALMHRAADLIEQEGADAWYRDDIYERLGVDTAEYERVDDILDVWFDSGVSHFCVLDERDELTRPADLYLEGSDQHRGWFQSSLLTGVAINGEAPYRQVLTHGFTVDTEGRKMSKSLGNVVSPHDVMKTLGADVLRLWVAAADYRQEMAVSDEVLKRVADAYRRIRNTARFLLGNLDEFTPADALPADDLLPLDRWAVDRALQLQQKVEQAYDDYAFFRIYQQIHHFCVVDMGAFYLDVIKDRLYTTGRDSRARRSAQTAMFHVLEALVRWVAPILSFTAEEIWALMPPAADGERPDSVFMATAYEELFELDDAEAERARWEHILAAREAVNAAIEKLRAAGGAGSSLAVVAEVWADGDLHDDLQWLGDELRFILLTSGATLGRLADAAGDAERHDTDAGGVAVRVTATDAPKCVRCWHRRDDVGQHAEHPELCGRCVTNVDGPGEDRRVA